MLSKFQPVINIGFRGQARQHSDMAAFGEEIFARYCGVEADRYLGMAFVHRRFSSEAEPAGQVALNIQMVLNSYSQAENNFLTGQRHILQQLNQQLNNYAAVMPSETRSQLAARAERALRQPTVTIAGEHTKVIEARAQAGLAPKKKADFPINRGLLFPSYLSSATYSSLKTMVQQQFTRWLSPQQTMLELTHNRMVTQQLPLGFNQPALSPSSVAQVQSTRQVVQTITQAARQTIKLAMTQNMARTMTQTTAQTMLQAVEQVFTQNTVQNLPQFMSQNMSQHMAQNMSQNMSQHMAQNMAQHMAQNIMQNIGVAQIMAPGMGVSKKAAIAAPLNREFLQTFMLEQQIAAVTNTWQRQISLLSYLTQRQVFQLPPGAPQQTRLLPLMLTWREYQREQQAEQVSRERRPNAPPTLISRKPQHLPLFLPTHTLLREIVSLITAPSLTQASYSALIPILQGPVVSGRGADVYNTQQIWRQTQLLTKQPLITPVQQQALTQMTKEIAALNTALITTRTTEGKIFQTTGRIIRQTAEQATKQLTEQLTKRMSTHSINQTAQTTALPLPTRPHIAGQQNFIPQEFVQQSIIQQNIGHRNNIYYNGRKQSIFQQKAISESAFQQSINQSINWNNITLHKAAHKYIIQQNTSLPDTWQQNFLHQNKLQQNILHQNSFFSSTLQRHISQENGQLHHSRSILRLSPAREHIVQQKHALKNPVQPHLSLHNIILKNTVQREFFSKILSPATLLNARHTLFSQRIFAAPHISRPIQALSRPGGITAASSDGAKAAAQGKALRLTRPPSPRFVDTPAGSEMVASMDNIVYLRRENAKEEADSGFSSSHRQSSNGEYLNEAALEAQTLSGNAYRGESASPLFAEAGQQSQNTHTAEPPALEPRVLEPLVEDVMEHLLSGANLHQLADKVYESFERRIKYEKRRFGL